MPAAEPSRSHFVCSFHGNDVSRVAAVSPTMGAGSSVAQDASPTDTEASRINLKNLQRRELEISASINDCVSLLNPGSTGQVRGNDIADSRGRFN